MTWPAFFHPEQTDSLHFKLGADQLCQIPTPRYDVSAQDGRQFFMGSQCATKRFKDLAAKESNLSLIIVLVIEKAVAPNPTSGYTFYLPHFHGRIVVRELAMMTKVVMAGRNI